MSEGPAALDAMAAPQPGRLDETRMLIAIGDSARERLVLQLLAETVENGPPLRLVRRCLDADDLLGSVNAGEIDAAIVSADLHGLGMDALSALAHVRIPLVLWGVNAGTAPQTLGGAGVSLVPRDVDVGELRAAVRGLANTGGRLRRSPAVTAAPRDDLERVVMPADSSLAPRRTRAAAGTLIALVGACGGPGVSVLAAGLAAALSREVSAALVDLNLEQPSQALALDLNPARNLYMVLHEVGAREDPALWARYLESELQPLGTSLPRAVVLAGAPSTALAATIDADGVRGLLRHLSRLERFVVADVGSALSGGTPSAAAHRAALETADRVFVVARSDLLGLRRAAHVLDLLRGLLDDHEHRLSLLLNQHESNHHHDRVDVARALRTSVAAVIPNDPQRVHAALADERRSELPEHVNQICRPDGR